MARYDVYTLLLPPYTVDCFRKQSYSYTVSREHARETEREQRDVDKSLDSRLTVSYSCRETDRETEREHRDVDKSLDEREMCCRECHRL